jgi:hypothetical protein
VYSNHYVAGIIHRFVLKGPRHKRLLLNLCVLALKLFTSVLGAKPFSVIFSKNHQTANFAMRSPDFSRIIGTGSGGRHVVNRQSWFDIEIDTEIFKQRYCDGIIGDIESSAHLQFSRTSKVFKGFLDFGFAR